MPEETFRDYCANQIERLGGAFPDFRFYKPGAVEELVNWLEAKAHGSRERAAGVITEATEFAALPSIVDLNAVWNRMYPPAPRTTNPNCPRCNGTGWEIIRRGGAEGTIHCPMGCAVPEFDQSRTPGTPGTPEDRKRLQAENSRFAAELARDLAGSLVAPKVKPATVVDIEAIKAEQARNRKEIA